MQALDYRIVDADNHYYEADDCFTRHIESRYRARTISVNRKTTMESAECFWAPIGWRSSVPQWETTSGLQER